MMDIPNNQQPPNPSSLAVKLPKIVFMVLLVFVAILGLVVAGDYFKIFPFSNYNSIIKNPFQKQEVSAESEIPGVTLAIANKERLMKYLDDYKFFNKRVKYLGGKPGVTISVNKLVFRLVNQEQDQQRITHPTEGLVSAIGDVYDEKNKQLTVKIYVSPLYISDFTASLTPLLDRELKMYLYKTTHNIPQINNEISLNYLSELRSTLAKERSNIFVISK